MIPKVQKHSTNNKIVAVVVVSIFARRNQKQNFYDKPTETEVSEFVEKLRENKIPEVRSHSKMRKMFVAILVLVFGFAVVDEIVCPLISLRLKPAG